MTIFFRIAEAHPIFSKYSESLTQCKKTLVPIAVYINSITFAPIHCKIMRNIDIQSLMRRVCFFVVVAVLLVAGGSKCVAQINTDQVMNIGRNALYFEDYILSIQYFNQVIKAKPYLADPYFYRAIAKLELEDYKGAEEDCSLAIERNPFIVDAYQVRGIARQVMRDYKGAIADYDEGLKQMPEHQVFLMNKAVCECEIGEYASADSTYAQLTAIYPNYANAYLGRAQLRLEQKDTVAAIADIDKSISISKNIAGAYVMRSDLHIRYDKDFKAALADMDEAIKLEPRYTGYFINRAYIRYNLDDYFGAMADYDYALQLDPANVTAHFNRGLLRTEVSDNNKAIEDFSFVLRSEPDNLLARYNRALLYSKTGQYREAVADFDAVLAVYPDFDAGLYARSECKRKMGDMAGGEKDYNRARDLSQRKERLAEVRKDDAEEQDDQNAADRAESAAAVMNKFNTLLTVENDNEMKPKYENRKRGRIQDFNYRIDLEPMFFLSYYDRSDNVVENTYYIKEVTDLNQLRLLPFVLLLTNSQFRLYEDQIESHFRSIEYYNGLLATSTARSVDYFARAMDFMMVKNPAEAINDFTRAIEMSPNFSLAYMGRSYARYMQMQIDENETPTGKEAAGRRTATTVMGQSVQSLPGNVQGLPSLDGRKASATMQQIMDDLDKVCELSPRNVYAIFNKGNLYMRMQDFTAAISCYTEAIEIKPDFGEAYYNRGLVYLQLGNKANGIADLSKAGELGILPSYNVLKRMTN